MGSGRQVLAGEGVHLPWRRVPARVREAIGDRMGGRVVRTRSLRGGFSPGLAAEVVTADGARAFVKAAGPEPNPDSAGIHRREAAVVAALPASVPAPPLLWTWDEGPGGWVALAFAWVDGRMPRLPWRAAEIGRVLAALDAMAAARPPADAGAALGRAQDAFAGPVRGWGRLCRDGRDGLLHPALGERLDELCALEAAAPAAARGEALVHFDVRHDNLLLDAGGRVWVVDWPHACLGAAWLDVLMMLPSVAIQGGPAPERLAARSAALRDAPATAVDAVLAAIGGYFTRSALEPAPPGLPTLRAFQAAQGEAACAWLARRRRWE